MKLPDIFQDGMVLQRGKKIRIWGTTSPNTEVQISLGTSEQEVISNENGKFITCFPPQLPGKELSLKVISNGDSKIINHVKVGEVYLLAGQSNMNLNLRYDHDFHTQKKNVLNQITNNVYYYEVPKVKLNSPKDPLFEKGSKWKKLNDETAENFSAVGFYFALELSKKLPDLPIGLVWMAYDGTTASSWTSKEALENNPILKKTYIDSYDELLKNRPKGEYEKFLREVAEQSKNQDCGPFWDNVLMGNIDHDKLCEAYKNHHELFVDYVMGPESENRPHGLFETMVSRIVGYTIKGMLWYQGESDDIHAGIYDILLKTMITDWRNRWDDNFPVLEMQVAPFYHWFGIFYGTYFPTIREKQEIVAKTMSKVYMTNVMDAGMKYDIHPKNKKIAGKRFALLAFDKIYNWRKDGGAPMIIEKQKNGNEIELSFSESCQLKIDKNIEDSLIIKIAGENTKFTTNTFENRIVIMITSRDIENEPVELAYQWEPYSEAKIFNENNIPVSPFKLDL